MRNWEEAMTDEDLGVLVNTPVDFSLVGEVRGAKLARLKQRASQEQARRRHERGAACGWEGLAADVTAELERARAKFPRANLLTTALSEEYGEAVRAVLEHLGAVMRQNDTLEGQVEVMKFRHDVRKELVQTIAMCVRLEQEGDPDHKLPGSGRFR